MLTITLLSLVVAAASGFIAWRSIRREHLRSHARVASLATAIDATTPDNDSFDEFRREGEVSEITFEALGAPSSIRRRLITVASGAFVVVAGVVLIAMLSDRHEPAPQPRVVSPHAESLELLSLDAARTGSTLAVTGRVRSRTEEPLTAITAVVSAVDAKGRPIGRGSASLDAIMPRRDSQFVITIGDANDVARYRVSFRSAAGVIRHVDRRSERPSNES